MADFPYLPFWTSDYLADTRHLSQSEHGAYLLLIMTCWQTKDCALPDDDKMLARFAGCDLRTWKRQRETVLEGFVRENGRLFPRQDRWGSVVDWSQHPSKWPDGRWSSVRRAVLTSSEALCAYCGDADGPFEVDHVIPRASGGENGLDNLVVACRSCNRSKGAKPLDEWLSSRGGH